MEDSLIYSGTIMKYVGRSTDGGDIRKITDTEPVILLSTPSLVVLDKVYDEGKNPQKQSRMLLEFLYGHFVGNDQYNEYNSPDFKRSLDDLVHALRVPETIFLMIGRGMCAMP